MVAVLFDHVHKRFLLQHDRPRSIKEAAFNWIRGQWQNPHQELWALRDVNFRVQEGEALGIIGPNGSGKSTVLKLIARILEPTRGQIKVWGKVAALLELGAGFHPDLTGRENIYLNGAILGLSQREMALRFEEVAEFTELDHFLDSPIRHYSSGMRLRLGFSIATHVDADILLIDEILAVGDEVFRRKCLDRIHSFRREGKTIVFVSHSLQSVTQLCDRVIWIEEGEIQAQGTALTVADQYLEAANLRNKARLESEGARRKAQGPKGQVEEQKREPSKQAPTPPRKRRWGSYEAEIVRVEILDDNGKPRQVFDTGETMIVRLHYQAHQRIERPVFGIGIHRSNGVHITGPNTKFSEYDIECLEGSGTVEYVILSVPMLAGQYELSSSLYDYSCTHPYDYHDREYTFQVQPKSVKEQWGVFNIPCKWRHRPDEA
jgi:ABC-type polysaccharide/polyol phosphate transport system ATPase subunit